METQQRPAIYDRPTPAQALVDLIAQRYQLFADIGAVKRIRSHTVVQVGDIHFRLVIPDHPSLGLDVEFTTLKCAVCGWATIAKVCRDLGEIAKRIQIHYSAHAIEQFADLGNGERVPA